jgi:hypothetical protein
LHKENRRRGEENFNTSPARFYTGTGVKAWYLPSLIMTWSISWSRRRAKEGGDDKIMNVAIWQ